MHPLPLPIVKQVDSKISHAEERRLAGLARATLDDEPALISVGAFGQNVSAGFEPGPSLIIEDHSWIRLFERVGDAAYCYRAMLLAGDGDMVVVGAPRCREFEAYCRDTLGLGRVEVVQLASSDVGDSLAVRCTKDERFIEKAAALARREGCLNIVPYMGTGGVWMLARAIAERSRVNVRVAASPPRLTRRVNDKLWFARRVSEVLGTTALPPTYATFAPSALAARTASLARNHASVAVKLTDSASSVGNIVIESAAIRSLSVRTLRAMLLRHLRQIGWRGEYPLMVTAWERSVVSSPSVQLWIPPSAEGGPIVEGIFVQQCAGSGAVFVGALPADLPLPCQQHLAHEAVLLGYFLQSLGFFGRCSFDAILVGDDEATARCHWIECNGRWGGVSIPMTLANRLVGDWHRQPFAIVERSDLSDPARNLSEILIQFGDGLFERDGDGTGIVILSPSRLEQGKGFELMVLGRSVADARSRAEAAVETLLGPRRVVDGQSLGKRPQRVI